MKNADRLLDLVLVIAVWLFAVTVAHGSWLWYGTANAVGGAMYGCWALTGCGPWRKEVWRESWEKK